MFVPGVMFSSLPIARLQTLPLTLGGRPCHHSSLTRLVPFLHTHNALNKHKHPRAHAHTHSGGDVHGVPVRQDLGVPDDHGVGDAVLLPVSLLHLTLLPLGFFQL